MTTIGRPRDAGVEAKVLGATVELLGQHGYAGLRLDDVVAATGVAKSTIYRRWPSLAHLVVAAMAELLGERKIELSGDAEADLRQIAAAGLAGLRRVGPSLGALAAELHRQDDPELRSRYRSAIIDPIREPMIEVVRAGQASGVFRPGISPQLVVDALIGIATYRITVLHEPVDPDELDDALDLLLAGLRA